MKAVWMILNAAFLFLCASMYFGTGWSMVLFSFPLVPHLTPDNYYWVFVPEVSAAMTFFTWMASLMIVSSLVMIWMEWKTGIRWVPIVVLLCVLLSGGLTVWLIFPYNHQMAAGIKDPVQLQMILAKWTSLSRLRVGMWTVQWAAMMYYFGRLAWEAITPIEA